MSVDPRTLACIQKRSPFKMRKNVIVYPCGCHISCDDTANVVRLCWQHVSYENALIEHGTPFAGLTDEQRLILRSALNRWVDDMHIARVTAHERVRLERGIDMADELLGMLP